MDFTSVHNIHEQPVFEAVARAAPKYPALASNPDLLADVASVRTEDFDLLADSECDIDDSLDLVAIAVRP